MQQKEHWVGTWTASPAPAEGVALSNQTLRMYARASIGGRRLRIRFSNAHGTGKLEIGAARVGLREKGPAILPESDRPLTFGGKESAILAAGAPLLSDPVKLDLPPLSDLSVSLYLPGEVTASFGVTGRYARQTHFVSPPGDFTRCAQMPVGRLCDDWYFLSGVDVEASAETGGIVALGDSLTDANLSSHDAHARWPDELSRRLIARGGRGFGVMNQGLGGNRILHDVRGESGQRRFDRDVLSQPGITHAIVLLGINDIRNRWKKPDEEVSAEGMIAGLQQLSVRARACGVTIFAGTLLGFENENFLPGAYTLAREAVRQEVNAWIREKGAFDAVIDFEQALADPEHPNRMLALYDCGDHLHPSDLGYRKMGEAIDLSLFD